VSELSVAIVGYGLAGRFFHAPLIAATPGLAVASVVTSDRRRQREAAAEHPEARVLPRLEDALELEPDLVVVATANVAHVELASAALDRGVPVVVDKPLATTADDAHKLVSRAEQAGVMLTVFQNRRWDTDQLTLRRLIDDGALGTITRYESRFERWRPDPGPTAWRDALPSEEGGGVLLDLGSHLVDQALVLFGPVSEVYAEVAARRGTPGDDDVFIALHHVGGTISHLWASAVAPAPGPRLRVQGTAGGFVVSEVDPQEAALREGRRPNTGTDWGMPAEWERPRLVAGERGVPVSPEPGDWPRFYALMHESLTAASPPPVDPRDAVEALRILEAARQSARTGAVVAPEPKES
jgi:predicted dehydrogenase